MVLFELLSNTNQSAEDITRRMIEAWEYDYFVATSVVNMSTTGYIPPHFLSLLDALTSLYANAEDYDSAIKYWSEYLDYTKAKFGEQTFDYACSLANLGKLYGYNNNNKLAVKYIKQAQKILENIKPEIAPDMQEDYDYAYELCEKRIKEFSK